MENGPPKNPQKSWKIGDLAQQTGLTVRTLRYYDQTGLLHPDQQTSGGHRLYSVACLARLYRILALRRLGFSLGHIGALLDDPRWDLTAMLSNHAADTDRTLAAVTRLAAQLHTILGELDRHVDPNSETLFTIIEEMTMLDTPITGTTTLLVYQDLAGAHTYLSTTFGLSAGRLERDSAGNAVHAELFAGDHAIWLHPEGNGYRSPAHLGASSSMTSIAVDNVDAHYARAVEHGAEIIEEPVDQPYGLREYGARDAEGHLWYFHSPLD